MKITFKGMVKLQKGLKTRQALPKIKELVKQNGIEMTEKMKANTKTAFKKGYSQGDTASSIYMTMEDGGMTTKVGPTMDYDPYVEWGTRYMEAEPFAKPAFDEQKVQFKKDLERWAE